MFVITIITFIHFLYDVIKCFVECNFSLRNSFITTEERISNLVMNLDRIRHFNIVLLKNRA